MSADLPDLVYPVVDPESWDLRFSLRSACENAAGLFRHVWIVSEEPPSWTFGVGLINGGFSLEKFANVRAKIAAACRVGEVSDRFVLMNDDMFLLRPFTSWEPRHNGTLRDYLGAHFRGNNTWWVATRDTYLWMARNGHAYARNYSLHQPLLFDKAQLGAALTSIPEATPVSLDVLYERCGAGGEGLPGVNSKISDDAGFDAQIDETNLPRLLSSSDESFNTGKVGRLVRSLFPSKCEFEE